MFHAFQECLFQIEAHLYSHVTLNLSFNLTSFFNFFLLESFSQLEVTDAPITPIFLSGFNCEIVGDYVHK